MWCESKASRLTGNILDIQIGTSASAFISGSATKLTVKNNAATGSTIVSGSHVVVFGGLISATDNEMFVDNGSRVTLIQSTVTENKDAFKRGVLRWAADLNPERLLPDSTANAVSR